MSHAYAEALLVEQPAIGWLACFGWEVELATMGKPEHPAIK